MSNKRRLDLSGAMSLKRTKVRNTQTGRVLPCCEGDCDRPGYDEIRVEVDHEQPRWPGERRIYIFCSAEHRDMYVSGMRVR